MQVRLVLQFARRGMVLGEEVLVARRSIGCCLG